MKPVVGGWDKQGWRGTQPAMICVLSIANVRNESLALNFEMDRWLWRNLIFPDLIYFDSGNGSQKFWAFRFSLYYYPPPFFFSFAKTAWGMWWWQMELVCFLELLNSPCHMPALHGSGPTWNFSPSHPFVLFCGIMETGPGKYTLEPKLATVATYAYLLLK